MNHFDVVGYDENGEPIHGDVMGHGYGVGAEAAMAHPLARHMRQGGYPRMMQIPPRPNWRQQLAPGVIQPDEGMVTLTLTPQTNGGTFTATIPTITFQGQLQKPYRAERLLVSVVRTGTSATGRLLTQCFIGTDLQGAEINGWDAELVGQPGSFGTRLTLKAAEPGVLVRNIVTLSGGLTGTDTIFATMMFLGRVVH